MAKRIDLIAKIEKRNPKYLAEFRPLFEKFCKRNARDTTELGSAYDRGTFFGNYYQLYLYAALIGLKHQRRKELPRGSDKKEFGVALGTWNPQPIRRFLIAAAITKADIEWNALELLPEDQENKIDAAITTVRAIIEEYANGGLEIIAEKLEKMPSFFDYDKAFVDMIREKDLS
jgi:hypothetical protein